MRISDIRRHRSPLAPEATRVSARLDRLGRDPVRLWFDLPAVLCGRDGADLDSLAEAFVTAVLPHAARDSAERGDGILAIEAPVSLALGLGVERVSRAWAALGTGLAPVEVKATGRHLLPPASGAPTVQAMGFDLERLYVFGRRREEAVEPDRLLALWPHGATADGASLRRALNLFARQHRRRLLFITSNLATLHPVYAENGGRLAQGIGLIAAGHLLGRQGRRLILPASADAWSDERRGQLASLDLLLGSERLDIDALGGDTALIDQLVWLADETELLDVLAVCQRWPPEHRNCGRCGRCLHTMLALDALGLGDLPSFDWAVYDTGGAYRVRPPSAPTDILPLRGVMELAADRGRADLVARGRRLEALRPPPSGLWRLLPRL